MSGYRHVPRDGYQLPLYGVGRITLLPAELAGFTRSRPHD